MTMIAGGVVDGVELLPEVELFVAGVPGDQDVLEGRARQFRPRQIFEGPVRVMIEFYFERPRGVLVGYHTEKPDLGDLVSVVLDGLCGVFWLDNRQVCTLVTVKGYAETPGTNVKVQAAGGPRRKGVTV